MKRMLGVLAAALAVCLAGCAQAAKPQTVGECAGLPAWTLGESAVLSVPLPGPEEPESAPEDSRGFAPEAERALVELVNLRREQEGLPPLEEAAGLTGAARLRAMEMKKNGYLAHTRPDGSAWFTVLEREFPMECLQRGEVIARTDPEEKEEPDAGQWISLWEESPAQAESLCHPDTRQIGVGIYYSRRAGRYSAVAVALIGAPKEEAP